MSATVDRGLVVRWLPRGLLAASLTLAAAAATGAIDLPEQKDKLAEINGSSQFRDFTFDK